MHTHTTPAGMTRPLPWPFRPGMTRLDMHAPDDVETVGWWEQSPGRWSRDRYRGNIRITPVHTGLTVQDVIAAARGYIAAGWRVTAQKGQ